VADRDEAKTRRILDLDVKEVSLVDRPAIMRRFLITKRLEDGIMGNFEADNVTITKEDRDLVVEWLEKQKEDGHAPAEIVDILLKSITEDNADATEAAVEWLDKMRDAEAAPAEVLDLLEKAVKAKPDEEEEGKGKKKQKPDDEEEEGNGKKKQKPDEEEEEKAMPDDLKKAITEVVAWMKKMSKSPGAPTDSVNRVATFLGKVAGGKYPYPKPAGKTKRDDGTGDEDESGEPDDEGEGNLMVVKADGTIVLSQKELEKRRMFTQGRTKTLAEAVLRLAQLVREVDEDAAKALAEALKELPKGTPPDSQVRPAPAKKRGGDPDDEDDDEKNELKKTVSDLTKRLEDATKRLETIEKTRNPAQGGGGDGTDEPVQKGQKKGLWNGVLW
jgi:hypothetical protein